MGRTDAGALQVPEPLPVVPDAAEAANVSAASQIMEMLGRPSTVTRPAAPVKPVETGKLLDAIKPAATAAAKCPSCSAPLSGVEQKFERCLSCGKSFASAGSIRVGI